MESLLTLVVGVAVYTLPSVVAYHRRIVGLNLVLLVNILLGWTVVGWFVAILIALTGAGGRRCSHCAEPVQVDAKVCPHCRNDLAPLPVTLTTESR